jgi:hypothetical protein
MLLVVPGIRATREKSAAVGGQLSDLLAGNDLADLTGFRFDGDGVGRNGDGLRNLAHLESKVDTRAVSDL